MKILNGFTISKTTVYQVTAINGNGSGCYARTLAEAIKWIKKYDWFEPNDDGGM